jgi:hypothetical protein
MSPLASSVAIVDRTTTSQITVDGWASQSVINADGLDMWVQIVGENLKRGKRAMKGEANRKGLTMKLNKRTSPQRTTILLVIM